MKNKNIATATITMLLLAAPQAEAKIKYIGGNGSSQQQAVRIVGAHGEADGVHSEYVWLKQNRPGCTLVVQSLLAIGKRQIDAMEINCNGKRQTIYFDISAFFGKI
jgi:hypothetical protein